MREKFALYIYLGKLWHQTGIIGYVSLISQFLVGGLIALQVFAIATFIENIFSAPDVSIVWIIILFLSRLTADFFEWLIPYFSIKIKEKIAASLYMDILNTAMSIPYENLEEKSYFDTFQRAVNSLGDDLIFFIENILSLVISMTSFIGIIIALAQFNMFTALVGGIIGCITIFFQLRLLKSKKELLYTTTEIDRKSNYWSSLMLDKKYSAELRLFNLSKLFLEKWSDFAKKLRRAVWGVSRQQLASKLAINILNIVFFGSLVALMSFETWRGNVSPSQLVAAIYATIRLKDITEELMDNFYMIGGTVISIEPIHFFWQLTPNKKGNSDKGNIQDWETIQFNNVKYTHIGNEQPTLKSINLSINKGEKIAIVGENGSGKTTLIKLLLGLYTPTSGKILIGNHNLSEIEKSNWWKNLAVLPQDFVKYNMFTLEENIIIGDISSASDRNQMKNAAARSGVDQFTKSLSHQYKTILGKEFSNGTDLSGGQWQKLALARVFMKRDAKLIILDEPTASVDALTELEIHKQFYENVSAPFTIVVSHRLGSTRFADKIIVMKDGEIAESGTFEELMRNNSYYKEMYDAQASWYKVRNEQGEKSFG